jgi:P-type Ca2+ transporter type 2C
VTGIDSLTGLSGFEALERRRTDGPNELPSRERRTFGHALVDVIREPMTALLLACGAIYWFLGDSHEAAMLLGFVGFIVVITLYQERRTERAIEALRDLASPRALVIRDGRQQRIAGRDVVRDDVVVLAEGDRVPADGIVLSTAHCTVDESLLTGESLPVAKRDWQGEALDGRPGGDDQSLVYAGTLVVQGTALAKVTATGERSEIGRIGRSLGMTDTESTRLQLETRGIVWKLALLGGALSLAVALGYAVQRHDLLGGVLAGLTLAMAILPNEFPVVVTLFLALGAWRLSRRRVLTRRIHAVEALGSVTVMCVDKTGTLTENRMTVARLAVADLAFDVARLAHEPLPEAVHALVEYAVLASRKDPFDPMELAFARLASEHLAGTEHLHPDWTLVREYPLSRDRLAVLQVWRPPDGELVVACKGAPEAVERLCRLDAGEIDRVAARARAMAGEGLRVLAVARGALARDGTPPADPAELSLSWIGLVGLVDPVRPTVRAAIAECHAAGIRVAMLTGDYPATAQHIAHDIGIDPGAVISGGELAKLDDDALRARIRSIAVFARILPEQKLRIVETLKRAGEIVAMTGDGVNDAPALKAAHIGIAMGGRGTDVAREASQLVLLDDDFASLVLAVRTGRRIYDNLQKALSYILAIHLPIVGLTVLPIVFGWPLVLLPIHIAFLHLVIDPACSVVFEAEPEAQDIMQRPPRALGERLFGRHVLVPSLALGGSLTAVLVGTFAVTQYTGLGEYASRTITFATLILANLALILATRSWRGAPIRSASNPALRWVSGGAIAILIAAIEIPGLRSVFRFDPMHLEDLALSLAACAAVVAMFAAIRRLAGGVSDRPGVRTPAMRSSRGE